MGKRIGKRIVDILVGTILSVLAVPVVLVLAVGTCLTLRTWRPLFLHERVGTRGRPFRMCKLRTLPPGTFAYAVKGERPEPHVPRFARWLRRTHLDELPQLFLVPTGRMSLVGPRPKMPDRFEPVDEAYGRSRVQVPQGCTGLWQIGVHTDDPPDHAPQYDFFYLEQSNLRLDLWIMLRTVALMAGLAPRAQLADVPRWALRHRPRAAAESGPTIEPYADARPKDARPTGLETRRSPDPMAAARRSTTQPS